MPQNRESGLKFPHPRRTSIFLLGPCGAVVPELRCSKRLILLVNVEVAEREGFEPSVPVYPVQRFSKPSL